VLNTPPSVPAGRIPGHATTFPVRPAHRLTLLALAALAFLTGCGGGTAESVSTAVKDSSSAVATARIALRQDMDGKLTKAAASTSLDDELKEIQTSRNTVLNLSPATQEDRDTQQQALDVLDQCATGFATARAALAANDGGAPSLPDGDKALADAQDALKQLEGKVGSK
jgi:hypothetical protein